AILLITAPGDDEVPGRVHGHGRRLLAVGGVGVDAELAAQRGPGGAEPLGADAVAAAVLAAAVPGDDEVAGRVRRDGRGRLRVGGEGVDPELRAGRAERRSGAVLQRLDLQEQTQSAGA